METAVNTNMERSPNAIFSGNLLKTIAIVAMLIDHIAHVFIPSGTPLYIAMRFIGRITGPTMFYFIAEGYHYTKNKNRYTLRLAIFAAISYFPFIFCFKGMPSADNFLELNVGYTLLLGLLALRARHEIKNGFLRWGIIAVLVFASLPGDWSYHAMFMILAFDIFYGDFKKQAFAYCLIVLGFSGLFNAMIYPFTAWYSHQPIRWEVLNAYILQLGMFIPIILLYFYHGKKGRGGAVSKWSFYVFYPAHLLVLGVVKFFFFS